MLMIPGAGNMHRQGSRCQPCAGIEMHGAAHLHMWPKNVITGAVTDMPTAACPRPQQTPSASACSKGLKWMPVAACPRPQQMPSASASS
eukprot:1161864-Pelagomonas_calceolata.AAC.17